MKNILTILFILVSAKGYSQNTNPQYLGNANSNVIVQAVLNLADSPKASFNMILPDTTTAKTYFSGKLKGRWARQNGRIYYNPTGSRFVLADSITSSGGGGTVYDSVVMATQYRLDTVKANRVPYVGATSNVNLGTYNFIGDAVQFNQNPTITLSDRTTYWDSTNKTLATVLDSANNVILQLGQEQNVRVVNKTGATILDGKVVFINGAQGNRPTVRYAQADSGLTSLVIGVATQNIADNAEGFVTTMGVVNGFNTSGFTTGDELYLSATSEGELTNVEPSSPYYTVPVAIALNSTVNGAIFVHAQYPLADDTLFTANSNRLAPTQMAVKSYVDKRVKYTDTSAMLSPYATDAQVALKLNISDTANIRLRPIAGANMTITGTYPNLTFASSGGGGSADSITFATNYRVDTAKTNLRTSTNTKLNISDTGSMLTPYLRKVDTSAMLGGYLRKVDTSTLSNRINLKANTASPTFTGTATSDYYASKQYSATIQTLTDGATTTWNANNGCQAIWTIGGTGRTLTITNPIAGAFYTLKLIQGTGGSKTITTYPTNTKWSGGTAPTLSTAAGAVDIISFWYDGTNYNAMYSLDVK